MTTMLSSRCWGSSSANKAAFTVHQQLPWRGTPLHWQWQRPVAVPMRRGMHHAKPTATNFSNSSSNAQSNGNGSKPAPVPAQPAVEQEQQEEADPTKYPVDIFAALTPHTMGRGRQLALLAAGAAAEFALLGSLLWSPLLWALAIIASTPSLSEQHRREAALVDRAVARARAELLGRVPITPVENAWWLERLNGALWQPFVQPLLLQQNLTQWQDNLSAAAPKGWDVEIGDLSLGTTAPRLSSFQAFGQQPNGALAAVDCRLAWDTDSVRIVVRGKGPLGKFVVRVSALQLEGDLRLTPVLDQRMLLWAFKVPPSVSVRLAVQGPIGGAAYDVSQFAFIQDLLSSTIQETLVEPRRSAVSLDYDMRVEEAIATTIHLSVEAVHGVPRTAGTGNTRRAPPRISVTAYVAMSRAKRTTGTHMLAAGSRSVEIREELELDLTSREGIVRLEARDASRGGALVGTAFLWVSAARDGSTLLWSSDRHGNPLAQRWSVGQRPWRVTLPLEGSAAAEVDVGVSVDPWIYKQAPAASAYRSVGPRTVVLQVVEGRQLSKPNATAHNAPYIVLQYDQMAYATPPVYDTANPVWLRTFTFDENASLLTRRVRLEAWSHRMGTAASVVSGTGNDALRLERLGNAVINLDLATEDMVQDRWVPLTGSGGGEVRVRLAIVPGAANALPAREAMQLLDTTLSRTSSPSISVEVLSARLYLPLSSLDSQDGDSAAWMDVRLSHGGVSATGGGRADSGSGDDGLEHWNSSSGVSVLADGVAHVNGASAQAVVPDGASAAGAEVGARSSCLAKASFMLDAANPNLRIECKDTAMFGHSDSSLSSLGGEDEECCMATVDVVKLLGNAKAWEGWVQLDKDAGQVLLRLTLHEAAEPSDIPIDFSHADTTDAAAEVGSSKGGRRSRGGSGSSSPSGSSRKELEAAMKLRDKGGDGTRPEVVALEALLSETTKQASKVGSQVQELSQHAASNVTTWFEHLTGSLSTSNSSNGSSSSSNSKDSSVAVNQLFDPARLLPPAGATSGVVGAQGSSRGSNSVSGLLSSLQHQPLVASSTANLQKAMQAGWLGGLGKKVVHGAKELLPGSSSHSDDSSSKAAAGTAASDGFDADGVDGRAGDAAVAAAAANAAKDAFGTQQHSASSGASSSGRVGNSSQSSLRQSNNGTHNGLVPDSLSRHNTTGSTLSSRGSRRTTNGSTSSKMRAAAVAQPATPDLPAPQHAVTLSPSSTPQEHGAFEHVQAAGHMGSVAGSSEGSDDANRAVATAVEGIPDGSPIKPAAAANVASMAPSRAMTELSSHPLQDGSIDDWYDDSEYDF